MQVFGPAFRRNTRWSSIKGVPDLGDENTPYDQVERFYNFWYSFK
jgi:DnaJ family protein C protein 2